jgi:hypothetical protein
MHSYSRGRGHFITSVPSYLNQGWTNPGRRVARGGLNFVFWRLTFVGPLHGNCFMSLSCISKERGMNMSTGSVWFSTVTLVNTVMSCVHKRRETVYSLSEYHRVYMSTLQRSWLRHCATRRKIAGSVPVVVFEIFHWLNPSGLTVALGSTQPLTEIRARDLQ